MQVVVVGCGRVGSGLARTLEAEGHSVAIIDKLRKAFRRLPPDFSGLTVEGQDSTGKRWARLGSSKRMPLLPSRLETTPISSAPELPTKPLEWSGWWRESTTPASRDLSATRHPHSGHGHLDSSASPALVVAPRIHHGMARCLGISFAGRLRAA